MAVFGVDYSWGRPGVAALKRAGAKFACRYLSHDTSGKNLTVRERVDFRRPRGVGRHDARARALVRAL
jgi:hypothetical protein